MHPTTPALAGLCLAVLAAGCGQSSSAATAPPVSAFTDGTCRVAAPDVLALGKAARGLGSGPAVDAGTKEALKTAQDGLRTLAAGAEPAYKPSLDALVVSTGFVRIRADGNSYEPGLGRQLMGDYDAVLKACVRRSA